MNRKVYTTIFIALICLAFGSLTGCNNNSAPPVVKVVATSGSGQAATVGTAFAAPLVATVTKGGTPASGVSVTFTAPGSGASGTFTGGSATETDTTDANGNATSSTFTANATAGNYSVTAAATGASTSASFSLTNNAGAAASVNVTSGSGQSAAISTAFANPLVATVLDASANPVSGVSVTFTAPGSGASGTFNNGTATETDTTDSSGNATSSTFTANATTGGPYTVAATVSGIATPANFNLTNTVAVVANTYVFYLSGLEIINEAGTPPVPNYYAVAGAVTIDANGNILGGEQDYNDAFGITATDPITPENAALVVNSVTGQGTLTLTTGDNKIGPGGSGIETLGIQFVNTNHARIIQFDGSATSSGSLDLQTATSTSGNFAFTMEGVDSGYNTVVFGGVFTVGAGSVNGIYDVDDGGTGTTLGTTFSGSTPGPDAFGRGTVTGTGIASTLAYYVVGPEAMRLIDIDATDSTVGSAFGQGSATFTDASLGASAFALVDNPWDGSFNAVGSFSTDASGTISAGIGDEDELGTVSSGAALSGSYSASNTVGGTTYNGYGTLTFAAGLGSINSAGMYMTDPALNLIDPNNTTTGLGGALLAQMDSSGFFGVGDLIPQTDTSTASFTGNYAFGAQGYWNGANPWEYDLVGQGSVTAGALAATGDVSDPGGFFSANALDSSVGFAATPTADAAESTTGRYTMIAPNQLVITIAGTQFGDDAVLYQASGGYLFWMEEDTFSSFAGPMEQQGSLAGLPAVQKGAAKTKTRRSH